MITLPLPVEFNSEQITSTILKDYPDAKVKVVPGRMKIRGSGNNPEIEEGKILVDLKINNVSEATRIEMALKQAVFDLVPDKTDIQQEKDDSLKELLKGPAFVYILDMLRGLSDRVLELEKNTTKGQDNGKQTPPNKNAGN